MIDDALIAQYVASGRCACCGSLLAGWTPRQIVEAIHAENERTGYTPKAAQWMVGTPEHPGIKTVIDTFGSWNNAMRAAGFEPRTWGGGQQRWTDEEMLQALRDHAADNDGEPPTYRQWNKAGRGHPSHRSYVNRFGSWNNALARAGFCRRGPYGVLLYAPKRIGPVMIDAAPVAAAIRDYLGPHGHAGDLAARLGMSPSPILKILSGTRAMIEVTAADRLLTAINRPDVLAELDAA